MEKIQIYVPVDCIAHDLKELNDGLFSTRMLGNGFWIEPLNGFFNSPLKNSKLSLVTDKKHAYFFEINENVNILMHIGLDTVKLNGKPFNQYVKLGDTVNLNTKIVDVDLQSIKNEGYEYSCPITIDNQNKNINYEFIFKNKLNYKKGELIGTFIANVKNEEINLNIDLESYFNQKDFYSQLALKLNTLVGSKDNYSKVYNCITRLRFTVINKTNVKESEIKNTEGVKGLIWNGVELQIVIGQDVYKVKDEIVKLNNSSQANFAVKTNNQKNSLFKRFFGVIGGVMVPLIPVLIASVMMMGIVSILQIAKVMPNVLYETPPNGIIPEGSVLLKDANVFLAILKVISDAPLKFLDLFAAITAANYFGLSPIIGSAIGLVIANPILFNGGSTVNGLYGTEWTLFETGINGSVNENPAWYGLAQIKVMPFTNRPFVIIYGIYLASKLDVWIKSWIKPSFETVFRPLLVIFSIALITFFILGSIYYVIEQIVSELFIIWHLHHLEWHKQFLHILTFNGYDGNAFTNNYNFNCCCSKRWGSFFLTICCWNDTMGVFGSNNWIGNYFKK
ncbi:PTS glucose transporter subunit IIA [Spiroplasma taiwanense]|uniref:PTS glucose transporter subunit IIA n=1 Tax=Spiroplasma taiwanense TaxID=2145 RepID=UPI00041A2A63|nr:PTS glucose transporter subunit IIA [Spiroplasma taiwanense]